MNEEIERRHWPSDQGELTVTTERAKTKKGNPEDGSVLGFK